MFKDGELLVQWSPVGRKRSPWEEKECWNFSGCLPLCHHSFHLNCAALSSHHFSSPVSLPERSWAATPSRRTAPSRVMIFKNQQFSGNLTDHRSFDENNLGLKTLSWCRKRSVAKFCPPMNLPWLGIQTVTGRAEKCPLVDSRNTQAFHVISGKISQEKSSTVTR